MIIDIKLVPRASQNKIDGWYGEQLKIRLTSAPVDGAANSALVKFLAKEFKISQHLIQIVSGHTSRNKIIRLKIDKEKEILVDKILRSF